MKTNMVGMINVTIVNGFIQKRTRTVGGTIVTLDPVEAAKTKKGDEYAKFRIGARIANGKIRSYACIAFGDTARVVIGMSREKDLTDIPLYVTGELQPVPTDEDRDYFNVKVCNIRRMMYEPKPEKKAEKTEKKAEDAREDEKEPEAKAPKVPPRRPGQETLDLTDVDVFDDFAESVDMFAVN